MKFFTAAILLVAVAAAHAGLAPVDSAAVLSGPSGTVVRSGVTAPVAYSAPLAYTAAARLAYSPTIAAPVIRSGIIGARPLAYAAVPAGSGLEGQWIPDITERLYDDGSYKPEIYGF